MLVTCATEAATCVRHVADTVFFLGSRRSHLNVGVSEAVRSHEPRHRLGRRQGLGLGAAGGRGLCLQGSQLRPQFVQIGIHQAAPGVEGVVGPADDGRGTRAAYQRSNAVQLQREHGRGWL